MSHQKSKRQKRSHNDNVQIEESENGEYNAIHIPGMNDSEDSSADSELEAESDVEFSYPSSFEEISKVSYRQVLDSYTENQKQLQPVYTYSFMKRKSIMNPSRMRFYFLIVRKK